MNTMNQRLKDAVNAIRQFGEPIEVYWGNDNKDEPNDERSTESWDGSFADMKTLRHWLKNNQPDGRIMTIYCRGDFRTIVFDQPL